MNTARCVACRKPIGKEKFRKHEFTVSGQGTRRNFATKSAFWHESCWLAEEKAEAERKEANEIEFQKELTEAKESIKGGCQ